jgi:hypothetical protein
VDKSMEFPESRVFCLCVGGELGHEDIQDDGETREDWVEEGIS